MLGPGPPTRKPTVDTTFLSGANAVFLSELYDQYLKNPGSVDPSWATFFRDLGDGQADLVRELHGASWAQEQPGVIGVADPDAAPAKKDKGGKAAAAAPAAVDQAAVMKQAQNSINALAIVRAYRTRGHQMATLDPLHLTKEKSHPELDITYHGFTEADLDKEIVLGGVMGFDKATLRQLVDALKQTYCGHIGVEYMHVQDIKQREWLQQRIEPNRNQPAFSPEGKKAILERMVDAEGFEKFLGIKYTGTKRFGLDGGEATIPALEQILKRGGALGVKQVVLGMAHRGRLNVLVNVMHKPFSALFSEFQGNSSNPDSVEGSGDVKYHLGTSADREFDGNTVHLSLTANPSHLEVVNPVVLGKVRAKQDQSGDKSRKENLALLIHGDAAFAGQGIIAECFGFSQIDGYTTGGTIHVVINNQIGFTTTPRYSRSGLYCTDVAKMVEAPIFHVNADDPEAVVHAARIVTEFRQEFGIDVVLDIVCYRRFGHNEGDEPKFTQPVMYKQIEGHVTARTLYAQRLVEQGLFTQEEADMMMSKFMHMMEADFEASASFKPNKADWLEGAWKGLASMGEEEEFRDDATGVAPDVLKEVGYAISESPKDVAVNSKISRQLKTKREAIDSGKDIDWATAEALAFGTLLVEGSNVRLSGQDCGRGTFSQRHSVLVDQNTEARFVPLNNIRAGKQGRFEVLDSPLSELSLLGFEYGYSLAEPNALTLWEAQFGDFSNGAQMIIDQFISSAESKWLRLSGLVMLLPHGYEGQGPEHSSARVERYLQMSGQDNWQVCNFTTPANLFHALRRQIRRNFRKPLIVFEPKSLLRHKRCVSTLEEFGPKGKFLRVIGEHAKMDGAKVRRVVLCTGKVYYDLLQAREDKNIDDVAIVRVEQLYPWPKETVAKELAKYKNAEVVWCQEEPANMGAWTFVDRRLEYAMEGIDLKAKRPFYAGRAPAASPATGLMKTHVKEQNQLVEWALNTPLAQIPQPFRRVAKIGKMAAE
ncbi:MAG: 2-oxoglutarate dehydrogenase E1 component [Rhodospirillaceae bacterium]|nr:2-oxoglutarate dehydrogenase E1 component [Rhodospirillaceae bacterium]